MMSATGLLGSGPVWMSGKLEPEALTDLGYQAGSFSLGYNEKWKEHGF